LRNLLRKSGIFFLLLLAAIPFMSSVFFQVQQDLIKQRMKHRLHESLLTTITLPANEVNWIVRGKEISVNGRYFDIRFLEVVGENLVFTGLFDDEETDLVDKLKNAEEQCMVAEEEIMSPLFQFLQSSYDALQDETFSLLTAGSHNPANKSIVLPSVFLGILTPPPQA
jgi:hypothetical protein